MQEKDLKNVERAFKILKAHFHYKAVWKGMEYGEPISYYDDIYYTS